MGVVVRSEHRTTADEWDFFTRWRKLIHDSSVRRNSAKLKRSSHRRDRRKARQRDWLDEY